MCSSDLRRLGLPVHLRLMEEHGEIDVNDDFAQDCGGHWEGSTWFGCGVCENCATREEEVLERERDRRRELL